MKKSHSTHPVIYVLFLALLMLALFLMPKRVVSAKEPRSEFTTESGSQRADVTLRYPDRKVEVKVIDRKKLDLPNSIQITLFNKEGKRTDIELSAIQPVPPAGDEKYKRDYRGVLPSTQDSYIGAELKLPLPSLKKSH